MTFEQRQHRRHEERLEVVVEPFGSGWDSVDFPLEVSCSILDLSETGLRLECDKLLPLGAQLELHIMIYRMLGGVLHLSPVGEVQWATQAPSGDGVQVGVKFTRIAQDELEMLKTHLSHVQRRA